MLLWAEAASAALQQVTVARSAVLAVTMDHVQVPQVMEVHIVTVSSVTVAVALFGQMTVLSVVVLHMVTLHLEALQTNVIPPGATHLRKCFIEVILLLTKMLCQ